MVKTTKPKSQKKKVARASKPRGNGPANKQRVSARGIDGPAREYAKLLNDPCLGRIVAPIYGTSGTGNYVRVESDFILGAEATAVGAAIIFVPGLLSAAGSGEYPGVITPTTVVSGDSTAIVWNNAYGIQAGIGLLATFGSVRAVAACLQVSYVGSEQTRAGVVSLTQTTVGTALNLNYLGSIRQASDRVVKMPDGTLEIKFAPSACNADFLPCGSAKPDVKSMPALLCGVSGIPSSTGVRFRLVQVLEWTPANALGVLSSTIPPRSDSTLGAVLHHMDIANPNWRYDLLEGLGAYAVKSIGWL